MTTTQEMREARFKLIKDAQAILTKEGRSKEDVEKATRMLDDAQVIKDSYEATERASQMESEMRDVKPTNLPKPGALGVSNHDAEVEAFRKYIVYGQVTPESSKSLRSYSINGSVTGELRDLDTPVGSAGGFTVPTLFNPAIEQAQKAYGKMQTIVRNWQTDSGAPYQWPLSNDVTNYSQEMTDGVDVTEADMTFGQITLPVSNFSTGLIKVSRSLLQDSAFNLEKFISDNFAIRVARGLNKAVTLGSTSGAVQGIVAAATSVATSAAPTTIGYEDLVALYRGLDPAYVENSTFVFNNTTLTAIIGLLDGYGRPLFNASISQAAPDTILGRPFVINQDLANLASASTSILFGDFSKYVLRSAQGLDILRLNERYAAGNQVGFVGFHRNGGRYLDAGTHPIVSLTQHV